MAFLSGCEMENDLEGNGNVTTNRRYTGSFTGIDINGVLDVYLTQSDAYKVEVVTDENLQDVVEVENHNNVLYVKTKDDAEYNATQMDVYITCPDITRINLDGVTALYTVDTLNIETVVIEKQNTGYLNFSAIVDVLKITSNDVGTIELSGKGHDVTINNNMIGDINAFGFKAYNLTLVHDGSGKVDVFVTNNFDVDISGVGNVYCKGNPTNVTNTGENMVGHLYMVN